MWPLRAACQAINLAFLIALAGLALLLSGCGSTLEIAPASAHAAPGAYLQLAATEVSFFGNAEDVTSQVAWSSSDPTVAAFKTTPGTVSALRTGNVTLTAHLSGSSGEMHFAVTSAVLQSIEVTPAAPSMPNGLSEPFAATGIYSDQTTQDLTQQVTWMSSTPSIATISNAAGTRGLASAVAVGRTSVSAAFGGVTGSTNFTVTSATLLAIQVTRSTSTLPKGVSGPFVATGIFSDHSTQNLTAAVTWSSSSPAVAIVSNTSGAQGVVSAAAVGSATISAASGGLEGSANLTVTSATLASIAVTPANPTVANGLTEPFAATGTYTDGSTQDLTSQVTWSSSRTSVAAISNAATSRGLASSAGIGTTAISAMSGGVAGNTSLTVTSAALVSIAVTPALPSIANGLSEPFAATGIYTDNSTQNITTQVTWASFDPTVASISNAGRSQGLASSASVGNTTITATRGGISGTTGLAVTSASLVSISVTPAMPSVANGLTEPFTATGTYTDNTTQNLTTQVTWLSSNTNVASVSNAAGSQGLGSSAAVGSTTISATSGGISGSTSLTVTSAALASIEVTPANRSIANGLTQSFMATGIYTDNSSQNLTTQVTWSTADATVATISNANGSQGLASSSGIGNSLISAARGGISGSTNLTVTSAALVSITVAPANSNLANGLNEPFSATGTYTDNSTQSLTTQVTWASSDPSVATISNAAGSQGLASSAGVGSTSISATLGSVAGSTGLSVTSATLVSIAVTPASPGIANGLTDAFVATGTYTDNSTQNITTQVTWTSSDTSVATISNAAGSQGLASSAALGNTTVSAASGGISGSTVLTVTAATLQSITVTPANSSIVNGLTGQLVATGTFTDNSTQDLSTQVTWASSNQSVASISNAGGSQGLATAAALGSTSISAATAGISGSTSLTVVAVNGFTLSEVVTIDHTQVGNSDSTNFPLFFSGTYSVLATAANAGLVQNTVTQQGLVVPADAVFTSDSGCTSPLSWEVENYDPASGAVNIWVKIPTLSHTVDTVIYLCIGDSAVTSYQGGARGAVWDNSYQAVYHFGDGTTLGAGDSTANGNDGTNYGATATAGEVGGAANVVNLDSVASAYGQNAVTAYTVEAWINTSYGGASIVVQDRGSGSGSGHSLTLTLDGNGDCGSASGCGGIGGISNPTGMPLFADDTVYIIIGIVAPIRLNDGTWHHLVGTWSAPPGDAITTAEFSLYVDGSPVTNPVPVAYGSDTSPLTGSGGALIGFHEIWYTDCNCSLDEVRLSTAVRSADWIKAEFNNQANPSAFYRVTIN